jgi:hypothetical protein
MLMLVFGLKETSDSWVDALTVWWQAGCQRFAHITRLVIYLDNGPNNNGRSTQFLKRMVQFADGSGLEIRLVYYPPYHSKYNPVERCWSALEKKWAGVLLNSARFMLQCAQRMTWNRLPPTIALLNKRHYPNGIKPAKQEMERWEERLERSATLPKYDITIKPLKPKRTVE